MVLSAALCALPFGSAAAGDIASGKGWSLTDAGVITVGADYEWAEQPYICLDAWVDYANEIKSVIIESGVTAVGSGAFCKCESITSLSLPDGVTRIGDDAFNGCKNLGLLTLPQSVSSLGATAFAECSSIERLELNNGLTSIGEACFRGCAKLKNVSIPESVTSIGSQAFMVCTKLESVSLPGGLTKLAEGLLKYCVSLKSVKVPDNVTEIENSVFEECTLLTSVSLPAGLTTIADAVFMNCAALEGVSLPSGLTVLGHNAFCGCKRLASIDIPDGVASIGISAFEGCVNLAKVKLPADLTTISNYAFLGCRKITEITFPAGVTSVGESAFTGCTSLRNAVSLAAQAPSIGGNTFDAIGDLLLVPEGSEKEYENSAWSNFFEEVTYVADRGDGWLLTGAGALTVDGAYTWVGSGELSAEGWNGHLAEIQEVETLAGVVSVSPSAFRGCEALENVILQAGLETIGGGAFAGCENILSVASLSAVPPALGEGAFVAGLDATLFVPEGAVDAYKASDWAKYFTQITSTVDGGEGWSLSADGTLTVGADYAWNEDGTREPWVDYCDDVKKIVVEEGVTKIGIGAFGYFHSLTSVSLPQSLTDIEDMAFFYCDRLLSLDMPDGVTKVGVMAFGSCTDLTSVHVSEGMEEIQMMAFYDCPSLGEVNLPDGLTTIGVSAFEKCASLTDIVIPASVTEIGETAFMNCNALRSVTCLAVEPPAIGDWAFSAGCPLYVPAEALDTYKGNEGWSMHFSKIFPIGSKPTSAGDDLTGRDKVAVEGGVVTVGGSPATEVYSLQGRRMPAGRPLGRGLYVVATPRGAVKVVVR